MTQLKSQCNTWLILVLGSAQARINESCASCKPNQRLKRLMEGTKYNCTEEQLLSVFCIQHWPYRPDLEVGIIYLQLLYEA